MELLYPSNLPQKKIISKSFNSKLVNSLKPTLQRIAGTSQVRLFVVVEKAKCSSTTPVEIQSVQDSNTIISIILTEKPVFYENEIHFGLDTKSSPEQGNFMLLLFQVPEESLTCILSTAKKMNCSVCSLQTIDFATESPFLMEINPPECMVKILEEDSMWFFWGIREIIRTEFTVVSLESSQSLPSFLEEGLVAAKRLDRGEPVALIAKDMKMDRSTVHKKVKIARCLCDYPHLKTLSFNKALEFVRSIDDTPKFEKRKAIRSDDFPEFMQKALPKSPLLLASQPLLE